MKPNSDRYTDRLTDSLAEAAAGIVSRVRNSLVAIHNGHHGAGAGIIWRSGDERTWILTNHHVIAHGHQVRAALEDGREFPARLVADDPEIDLALLEIDAGGLTPVVVAEPGSLRVGQLALAVGHPWGQRGVVTAGMVSSLTRAQTRGPRGSVAVIRSDARLAPGNSGGPLVDAAGRVVGINTLIIGGDQGIAVAAEAASQFVQKALKEK